MHILIAIALIGAICYFYELSTIFNGLVGGIFRGIKYLVVSAIAISLIFIAVMLIIAVATKEDKAVPQPIPVADYADCPKDTTGNQSNAIRLLMDCRHDK